MKLSNCLPVAAVLICLLTACKPDKTEEPAVVYPNYSQLKVGNYWVYQRYNISANGMETATNIYDSIYIEKDTIISGIKYYKQVPADAGFTYNTNPYLRDSLHYLVNSDGQILFSSQNFSNTFNNRYVISPGNDTVCQVAEKMEDKDFAISTASGTYATSSLRVTYNMYPNWSYNGSVRYLNTRYAENVGVVSATLPIFVSNPDYVERRLVRYHLN